MTPMLPDYLGCTTYADIISLKAINFRTVIRLEERTLLQGLQRRSFCYLIMPCGKIFTAPKVVGMLIPFTQVGPA